MIASTASRALAKDIIDRIGARFPDIEPFALNVILDEIASAIDNERRDCVSDVRRAAHASCVCKGNTEYPCFACESRVFAALAILGGRRMIPPPE